MDCLIIKILGLLKEFILTFLVGFAVLVCTLGVVSLFPPYSKDEMFWAGMFFWTIGTLPQTVLLMILFLRLRKKKSGVSLSLIGRALCMGICFLSWFLLRYPIEFFLSDSQLAAFNNMMYEFGCIFWFDSYLIISYILMFLSISVWYYWRNHRFSKQ